MRRADALATIQICLLLLGIAWLDRAFEGHYVPPLVAEVHRPDADVQSPDDGEQDVPNLTVPTLPFVPNFVAAFPQISTRSHAAIFDMSPIASVTLMLQALARRLPVPYVAR
jgi:hypothetical protein